MRFLSLLLIVISCTLNTYAQTDNEFWFAAPDVSSVHGDDPWNGAPIYMHFTAAYATHVILSRPADLTFVPIEFDLAEMEHYTLRLDNILAFDEIENYPSSDLLNGMQINGFKIESDPGEITVYYELDQYWNRDIFPLKGKNALGRDFWVSTQDFWNNGNYSGTDWSGFVIVATENNTTVTVQQNDGWLYFPIPAVRTVVLNAGETFVFRAADRAANRHINGVHVTSDKDIAITIYDDSMAHPEGCRDIMGDQIVPVEIVGREYIVMRGYLYYGERIFVTATENATEIFIDGVSQGFLNAGDVEHYSIVNVSTHVSSDKPIYVNHITGFGCEMGGALLPTIEGCTGSHDVTFTRTPNGLDNFYVNIMVRNDTVDGSPRKNQSSSNFTLTVGAVTYPVPEAYFDYIDTDSAFVVLRQNPTVNAFFATNIPPGAEARVSNSVARFHLGVINGGAGTGCKYGYFSDYASSESSAGIGGYLSPPAGVYCNLDPIHLVAGGGISYHWYSTDPLADSIVDYLSDTSIADPYLYPPTTADYSFNVDIEQECFADTTITIFAKVVVGPNANFVLSDNEVCSPNPITITNTTNTALPIDCDKMVWVFTNPYQEIDQDTISNPFTWTFPENNTDSIINYTIELHAFASFYSCGSEKTKTVSVKPRITAGFDVDTNRGCPPLDIQFTNQTTGHYDSTSFYWDFGDYSQSFEEDPVHRYYNFDSTDHVYTVRLTTESPFGCLDSISKNITVHPRVRTVMAIETSASCSPLDIELNPGNSIGVDTFYWHIDYFYGDSNYIALNKDPIYLYHRDTSITAGPDTLHINLWGMNQWGCVDSFPQRDIVVFPEVHAEFDADRVEICDADTILFANHSVGYKLFYNWDFDDGTILQDTLGSSFLHNFYNRSDADSVYNVQMTATSEYFCDDEYDTLITVHPFIRANFGIDYDNNCTPVLATFSNLSVRAHLFEWDFGDGSPISNTSDPSFTHQYWNENMASDTMYYVRLVTENFEGCTDTLVRTISVYPHVIAAFNLVDPLGCSPLAVTFNNNSSGGSLSYLWNFGNGTTSTNPSPTFIKNYTNLSHYDTTYYISLTASNPYGCDSVMYDSVNVFASIDANFNLPITDSCSPFTIKPENLSSAGANIFEWDFIGSGLGTFNDYEPNVPAFTNLTSDADTIIARLVAYGAADPQHLACADTHSVEIVVYPLVIADFSPDQTAFCSPDTTFLTNNSVNADNYVWTFSDGSGSSAVNPSHVFENFNNVTDVNYTIDLLARSMYNCTDDTSVIITVYAKPDADFYFPTASDCPPFELQMTNISVGSNLSYFWNFAGESTSTQENPSNIFGNDSTVVVSKPITLTVTSDRGCVDSIMKLINIYPNVRVAFTCDVTEGCSPLDVQFTGDTINVSSMLWYINGQTFSPLKDPSHRFVNDTPGDEVYEIKFSAISQFNCYDDTTGTITVFPNPTAEFIPSPMIQSYNSDEDQTTVAFNNETFYQSSWSYEWDYGDGVTDNQYAESFDHIYGYMYWGDPENNYYFPVQMVAWNTDNPECRDTIVREIQIRPPLPQVMLEEDISACVPFTLDFVATTKYVYPDQYEWDFDDGGYSTDTMPVHTFTEPGVYTVRLQVWGDGGPNYDDRIVFVYPRPTAYFTFNDSSVFMASQNQPPDIISFYNQTSGGDYYWWFFTNQDPGASDPSFSIENSQSTEKNPTWYYEEEGVYYVALIAQSDLGCYDTVVHPIPIYVHGEGNIQFPTAFTVDPAGARDEWVSDPADMDTRIFRPYAQGVEEYKLEIYNRWGVLIFESNDVNHGWNGYLQGQPAKQDVYMWRAKGRFTNGQPFEVSGDVTLLIVPQIQY